ncbi:MAG: VCBS repeat-containing protein [Bryobacterales bacterium]|jgi:hypothetical protein|nr:VCBS repeat-containing protein [Bryobacterales bacterium]
MRTGVVVLLTLAGLGILRGQPAFHPTSEGPYFLTAGDLNGDGVDDVVVVCRGELRMPDDPRPGNDRITVYFSESGGARRRQDFGVGFGPYTAAIADLDGDGRNDVAVVNFQDARRHLSILWGPQKEAVHLQVDGAFEYDKSRNDRGEPIYPAPGLTSLVVRDFDGDGKPDIAAVAWSSDFFVIFRNEGNRRFRQARYPLLPGPRDVAAADFNRDGHLDLAFTIYSSNLVDVWLGDGKGSFRLEQRFHAQGHIPYHLKAGDLDGDDWPDLVVGNRGPSDNVTVFQNRGGRLQFAGSFRPGTPKKGETTADEIRDILLTDADGDGKLDLVAACHVSHKVVLWRGTGSFEFGAAFAGRRALEFPGKGPRALHPLDGGIGVAFFGSSEFAVLGVEAFGAR